ncbi:MAG: hypothetical protein IT318_02295 [Anaerolineales bacterium]|nr:hypothetical protein [Anaerolineales bacterium]
MTEYLIFARKAYQHPLALLGQLRVEGAAGGLRRLLEQACEQFGREGWIEMIAIPQSAVTQVIPIARP